MKNLIIILVSVFASISFAQTKKAAPATSAPVKKTAPMSSASAPMAPVSKKSTSFARQYGLAGCGLGSVLMGKKGAQIFAATTNGSSFNQTFGISAGSLNCIDSASAEVAGRMDQFILVNRSQVQGDVARGNGETIAALSNYMGCEGSSNQIATELKSNYSNIFNSEAKANEITDSIITLILSQPALAEKCGNLS